MNYVDTNLELPSKSRPMTIDARMMIPWAATVSSIPSSGDAWRWWSSTRPVIISADLNGLHWQLCDGCLGRVYSVRVGGWGWGRRQAARSFRWFETRPRQVYSFSWKHDSRPTCQSWCRLASNRNSRSLGPDSIQIFSGTALSELRAC